MKLTVAQLAKRLKVEFRGDGGVCLSRVASLQRAEPGALSFLANPKYRRYLKDTRASAVVLSGADAQHSPVPVLVSDNPYACYARAAALLHPQDKLRSGVHPSAIVDESAQIDPGAWIDANTLIGEGVKIGAAAQIGPGCVVGAGVTIGEASQLVARVTVLAESQIGRHVILHPGVVIGSDGFGLAAVDGRWEKVPQLGSVRIGNHVEIGANTTVDRGTVDSTVIEDGVKIDNQVQVAHNVFIGAQTAIAACVGICGSTRIGRHCTLAGGVGVVGHLEIADHVHITGMSMVTHSLTEQGSYSAGTPLMPNCKWRRNAVRFKQLDDLERRLSNLEKAK